MSQHLSVSYTGPAKTQLQDLVKTDPTTFPTVAAAEQWHEKFIDNFASSQPALQNDANKARVRAAAHSGGTDPTEPEHITVDYKKGNKIIDSPSGGAWHVYTGR